MIYDCFTFFDEYDLIKLRLNELNGVVDKFIIVEADGTFKGDRKGFNFKNVESELEEFKEKIIYCPIKLVKTIPIEREEEQRQWIVRALEVDGAPKDSLLIIGDLDEIPTIQAIEEAKEHPDRYSGFVQMMFIYYMNWLWETNWIGPISCTIKTLEKDFKNNPHYARIMRRKSYKIGNGGWHFSLLGGAKGIREKIKASRHTEFNKPAYLDGDHIERRIKEGKAFANRRKFENKRVKKIPVNFLSNHLFPNYLLNNLDKYIEYIGEI